ncbi:PH domain-containing protein [Patescibacteria group bacterium]|nr:PH domain-containing protein [Patescibacteria group bacterium]
MLHLNHLPGADLHESKALVYRAHWFTLIPYFCMIVFVFLLPPATYLAFQTLQPNLLADPQAMTLFVLGVSIFFLYGLLFLFQLFLDYWLDVFILTDKRILDIEQKGLFNRTVSELRLYRTQDVTTEVKGFWHTMIDFGDIFIQTAGEKQRFVFQNIPHPNQVAKLILELAEENRKEQLEQAVEDFNMPDGTTADSKEHIAKKIEP